MPLVVIEDQALGPIDVGFLGAVGIVLEAYCVAYLVEQLLLVVVSCRSPKSRICARYGSAPYCQYGQWFRKETSWGTLSRRFLECSDCWCFCRPFLHNHLDGLLMQKGSVEVYVGQPEALSTVTERASEYRMSIVFTDMFTETCEGEFQVSRKQVYQTLNTPTSEQIEEFDNLKLGFFIKEESQAENTTLVLVCARRVNDQWAVDLGFRIRPELIDDLESLEPLALLQRLVESFGCEIRIGTHHSKFIFRKTIPIESEQGGQLELVEALESADQGLVYSIITVVEERESKTFVDCALAFCINTGKYVSWLLGWDDQRSSPVKPCSQDRNGAKSGFYLTNREKESIREFVKEMFPDDEHSQIDAAKYRGACVLLKKVFGKNWYQEYIAPNLDVDNTFLRRPMSDPLERYLQVTRVIELAEALHTLKDIPGISKRVGDVEGKTLESLWFEYFVPYLIHKGGHQVIEFVPESFEEKRPDLIVRLRDQLIPVEIKAKQEESVYSRRNLLSLVNKGFSQLPETGPGVIFLMVHSHWLQDEVFLRQAEPTIKRALQRNRNCNAICVFWPCNERTSTGEFIYQWRFQHFVTWHPIHTVPKITALIPKREMEFKPVVVTFLE